MTRKKFRDLAAHLLNDPERPFRVETQRQALRTGDAIRDLLEARGLLAGEGEVPRATREDGPLCVDRTDDTYLATLRWYIEELGGKLEIAAVFPDQRVQING